MKKFDKRVRWEFKIAIHGYGRNVAEALRDAARRLETQCESEFSASDFRAIEEHETIDILPDDFEES